LADRLSAVPGVRLVNESFFNEFSLRLPIPAADAVAALAEKGVLGGVAASRFYPDREEVADILVVAATETTTTEDIDMYANALTEVLR
jgi:glycine dehydrogenase subunit 1